MDDGCFGKGTGPGALSPQAGAQRGIWALEIEEREAGNGIFQKLDLGSTWSEAEPRSGCHLRLGSLTVTLRHIC